jgi:hypothetical protein
MEITMSEQETKIEHTIKFDRSIIKVLWVFAIALMLNAIPNESLISNAMAEYIEGGRLDVKLSGTIGVVKY